MMDNKPLSAKQQAFVQQYLLDYNATQAAIRAGYTGISTETSNWYRRPTTPAKTQ